MRFSLLSSLLAALLLFGSCQRHAPTGVKIRSQLGSYIPLESTVLAGVDIEAIVNSPFYKDHSRELDVPAFAHGAAQLGLNAQRDLSSALITFADGSPMAAIEGRWNADSVQSHLDSLGGQSVDYRGRRMVQSGNGAVFFPKPAVAVTGPGAVVRKIIDGGHLGIPAALQVLLDVLPRSDQVWIVSSKGLPLELFPMRADVRSAVSNFAAYVISFEAGLSLDAGAHLHIDMQCDSAENAKQLHDALRGAVGLARLATGNDQLALLKLYDTIQVGNDQQAVHVRADLPPELAELLLRSIRSQINSSSR